MQIPVASLGHYGTVDLPNHSSYSHYMRSLNCRDISDRIKAIIFTTGISASIGGLAGYLVDGSNDTLQKGAGIGAGIGAFVSLTVCALYDYYQSKKLQQQAGAIVIRITETVVVIQQ